MAIGQVEVEKDQGGRMFRRETHSFLGVAGPEQIEVSAVFQDALDQAEIGLVILDVQDGADDG